MFGKCFLTDIENYFLENKGSPGSFVTTHLKDFFGNYTDFLMTLVVVINAMVCLYKINKKI